ncbi:hypothetical protein CW304_30830 [Bacillus sp. UFRGS-B20]|nr:hypothetical protein CW304_30830 [Bacillus sp. UFRGS-B20]
MLIINLKVYKVRRIGRWCIFNNLSSFEFQINFLKCENSVLLIAVFIFCFWLKWVFLNYIFS